MAGITGLAAVAACVPQPDQQATIDAVGIDGRSGSTDLAVVVERLDEESDNPIAFREVKDADLSVAEETVQALRDELTVVTLSVLPNRGGRFTVAAPLRTNHLVTGGTDVEYVVIGTEDGAYHDVDIACEAFRAEQMGADDAGEDPDDGNLVELGNTFPLPVVSEFTDAEGELAAGGFNFDRVALYDLANTRGDYAVFECDDNGDPESTDVGARGGDGSDDDDSAYP